MTCGIVGHLQDKCPQLKQTTHAKSVVLGKELPNSNPPHRLPSISGMIEGDPRNQLTEQNGVAIPIDNNGTVDHSPKPNEWVVVSGRTKISKERQSPGPTKVRNGPAMKAYRPLPKNRNKSVEKEKSIASQSQYILPEHAPPTHTWRTPSRFWKM